MDADKKQRLFLALVKDKIGIEEVLRELAADGINPNLIFNEKEDTWGLVPKGIQAVKTDAEIYDIAFYLYGKKANFKRKIKDAVLFYIWLDDYYEDDDFIVKPDKTYFFKTQLN
jgi:hypothetical protein